MCCRGASDPRVYKLIILKLKSKFKNKYPYVLFAAYNFDELCSKIDKFLNEYNLTLKDIKLELANDDEARYFIVKK